MSRKPVTLFALSAFATLGLLAPNHAMAGAVTNAGWVTIDDAGLTSGNPNNILASLGIAGYIAPANPASIGSGAFNVTSTITNETPTTLGAVDMSFDYLDANPLASGTIVVVNYNIFGPNEPLSDTLSMTFRGLTPGAANTHVEVHFKSDNEVLSLTQLTGVNTFTITENGAYQDLTTQTNGVTGLAGFHLRFASDADPVPLPSAVWSGLALLGGLGAMHFVRRRPKSSISRA